MCRPSACWRAEPGDRRNVINTRIATLNIRHGGTRSAEALATRVLGYDADLLVITEFRTNAAGMRLIGRLEAKGYCTTHPSTGPNQNSVLIASQYVINQPGSLLGEGIDTRHLLCADVNGLLVCGVYMPQKTAKLPYWEALITQARLSGIDLLIGDFNTGNNDLDKDMKGSKFIGPEMPGRLIDSGYTDLWRSLHPGQREYSWYSCPGNNGFRLDYIFAAPELTQQAFTCEFDHAPRLSGETDHSALVASLGWP
ncbi:endonuclease/exonuclease/phosphatase family protein [Mycolicibacterium sp. GF69]|uniref:endonuclease/exonuclease/phosphatase family protein n=1 Tax=Mycolicibacterium sp. GF69 TaxID=2267251 RepID=UPI001F0CB6A9|nr:endonuclease/exonuclease/phosphatase family protein [Mycolicibacterium sp. GF69]